MLEHTNLYCKFDSYIVMISDVCVYIYIIAIPACYKNEQIKKW